MTPATDHTTDVDGCCPHDWCRAHPTLCDCPYSSAMPHRAEHVDDADDGEDDT